MLTIFGRKTGGYCDGISRRGFLKIGGLAFGSSLVTLPEILRAEEAGRLAGAPARRHKAVINVFLAGGPPHQDMWDLKPDAPDEIRGEFKPIPTNVTGIQVGEVFEQIAARMDRFSIIRSIVGAGGGHDAVQCTTGWKQRPDGPGHPSLGAVLSHVQGPVDPSVPPFVGLTAPTSHQPWSDAGDPGFLGTPFGAFRPSGIARTKSAACASSRACQSSASSASGSP